MTKFENLVSVDWLRDKLDNDYVKVIDGSWYLPQQGRDAAAEYAAGHVPGAVFFDLDENSDHSSDLPHMMPSPEEFADVAGAMGITNSDHVIVYDGLGFMSAPRIWWMFKTFGHEKVSVLDGGMPAWKAINAPVDSGSPAKAATNYQVTLNQRQIADRRSVMSALENGDRQIIDARSAARFSGSAPEPRAGLKSGHMPGAINLPFQELVATSGLFKLGSELQSVFEKAGVDLSSPVTTSCGSGVTAAILTLGLTQLGHRDNNLYDGSWAEWGSHPETVDKIVK